MRQRRRAAARWGWARRVIARSLGSAMACYSLPCGHERAVRRLQAAVARGREPATARLLSRLPPRPARDCPAWPVAEKVPCSTERVAGWIALRYRLVARV